MIDIRLIDREGKEFKKCGCGLPPDEEIEIYFALRNAILDISKLLEIFGDKNE